MLINRIVFTTIALAALSSTIANAQTARTSAGFNGGDKSLDKLLEFPELTGDINQSLLCQGILRTSGKLDDAACYIVQRGDELFAASFSKVIKKARFKPATIGGKPRGVYLQFRIHFSRKDKVEKITLLANQGYLENTEAYGQRFVAAQRALTKENWQKICPKRAHFTVISRAHIASDGSQSSISITHGSGINISSTCEQAIIETLEQSDFVPAFADGEPVPSSYVEAFGV